MSHFAENDAGRCPYVNTHFIDSGAKREDGWRCGKEPGHVNGHYLYSDDGDRVLDAMGPWVIPPADLCHEFVDTGRCGHSDAEHDALADAPIPSATSDGEATP